MTSKESSQSSESQSEAAIRGEVSSDVQAEGDVDALSVLKSSTDNSSASSGSYTSTHSSEGGDTHTTEATEGTSETERSDESDKSDKSTKSTGAGSDGSSDASGNTDSSSDCGHCASITSSFSTITTDGETVEDSNLEDVGETSEGGSIHREGVKRTSSNLSQSSQESPGKKAKRADK